MISRKEFEKKFLNTCVLINNNDNTKLFVDILEKMNLNFRGKVNIHKYQFKNRYIFFRNRRRKPLHLTDLSEWRTPTIDKDNPTQPGNVTKIYTFDEFIQNCRVRVYL